LINSTHWSKIIHELRIENGLTQRQLSERTNIPQRTISEYENTTNPRQLSIYKVEKILESLGYDLEAVYKDPSLEEYFPVPNIRFEEDI
tara:strand:+ start:11696 stop:11962 length:267 start_codon:yes stop_codon:yes gene_type:complete